MLSRIPPPTRRRLTATIPPGSAAAALLAFLTTLLVASARTDAQYFGQNRVQYNSFKFQVLKTEHFDIYHYPEERQAVEIAARLAERWHARLTEALDYQLKGRQPLILYASHPHFRETNAIGVEPGEGTGGVTEPLKRRIVLPFAGGVAETDHVLGHELVHAFQFDISTSVRPTGGPGGALSMLPLWFVEGMAEYLSLGPVDAQTAMWLRDAVARDDLPSVRDLDNPKYFPYRYGHAFWAYVGSRWGDRAVGALLAAAMRGGLPDAFKQVLGVDDKAFSAEWHEALRKMYAPVLEATRPATAFAKPLIAHDGSGGRLNIGPSLSPDGSRIVFLSERELFSIDMYLADARNGEIIRHIVRTATDPHFDSLQFLESSGTWSPDGRQFLFAAISSGKPVLTILDAQNGRTMREITLENVHQVFNPSWSPDGRRVVYSALAAGLLDLYAYDLTSGSVDRLTNDAFAELHVSWSPDGSRIAFSTDRFTSDVDRLVFGGYRLATMDLASREIRPVTTFSAERQTNPEWLPDGRGLVFVADPHGIPNVFRIDLASGDVVPLTNVRSGVSGITPLSPSLSTSARTGRIAFTIFGNDTYDIYATDLETARTAGVGTPGDGASAARLAPPGLGESIVAEQLEKPLPARTEAGAPKVEPYRPALSLDFVTQPTVGVGVDQFGAFAQGGIALGFSDILGNHNLVTAFQVNGQIDEIGGGALYLNRTRRWNWGVLADYTPYVTGAFSSGFINDNGQLVFAEQQLRIRQIEQGVSGLVQYPFNRAQRIELTGGGRRISFDSELRTATFDPITGVLLSEEREDLPRPDALALGLASAAFVHDTSIMGLVGPLRGTRLRFEASQVTGSLTYTGLLADFRKYFIPARPFTIAVRGVHYGRYGSGGEDPRLPPLFLGYTTLVRGYDVDSFEPGECGIVEEGCPVFDQLIGSRMLVANVELRVPPFGLGRGRNYYGAVPIELALFVDAGLAWTEDDRPSFVAGGSRDWVRSAGIALRANLFGFAIVEVDYVRPLDRPGRGWLWQFGFAPAF
jgi:Tol biopolymer transport system component